MIAIAFVIDIFFTVGVSIGSAWFFTSRYLASRTPTQLGKSDVSTLRSMRDELQGLLMLEELGVINMPEKNRVRIRALVETHDNQKELPR